jgi:hypothetical protein
MRAARENCIFGRLDRHKADAVTVSAEVLRGAAETRRRSTTLHERVDLATSLLPDLVGKLGTSVKLMRVFHLRSDVSSCFLRDGMRLADHLSRQFLGLPLSLGTIVT